MGAEFGIYIQKNAHPQPKHVSSDLSSILKFVAEFRSGNSLLTRNSYGSVSLNSIEGFVAFGEGQEGRLAQSSELYKEEDRTGAWMNMRFQSERGRRRLPAERNAFERNRSGQPEPSVMSWSHNARLALTVAGHLVASIPWVAKSATANRSTPNATHAVWAGSRFTLLRPQVSPK